MSSILFYTVGDRTHGMGHVVRCIVLADELRRRGHGITFTTEHETVGLTRIQQADYSVYDFAPHDLSWSHRFPADICIVDVENGPSREMLEAVRPYHMKVVVISGSGYIMQDREAIRELSDLFVCQTILPTDGDLTGAEHIIVDPAFVRCTPDQNGHILVSFGGSDPHDLAPLTVDALYDSGRSMIVVNGPASSGVELERDGVSTQHAPASLAPYLDGAALFIGALGMSAFEAAAAGVPAVLTAWSADHEATAKALAGKGCALSIGTWDKLDSSLLAKVADDILESHQLWEEMSRSGRALIDGQGVKRVADGIESVLSRWSDSDEGMG